MAIPEISPYLPPFANKVTNPALQMTQPVVPSLLPKLKVDQVKGYDGALAYQMGPDSTTIVVDSDQSIVWFIATDASGNKSVVQGYTITPYTPPKPVTLEDLMSEVRDMKERLMKVEEVSNNGKSDFKSAGKHEPDGSNIQTGNGNYKSGTNGKSNRNDKSE